jgi:hypothetical protein
MNLRESSTGDNMPLDMFSVMIECHSGILFVYVMVLDRPAVGTCLRRARRIISYFLLAEYMPLLHLL